MAWQFNINIFLFIFQKCVEVAILLCEYMKQSNPSQILNLSFDKWDVQVAKNHDCLLTKDWLS